MTVGKEEINHLLREFPKYKILEELREEVIREVKEKVGTVLKEKKEVDPIQKKRDEKNWKTTLGYYAINPHKFDVNLRNLKTKK